MSWTVVHRALVSGFEDHVPFVYALVELVEQDGLHMAAELLVQRTADLEIGQLVEVAFDDGEGGQGIPCFHLQGTSGRSTS